MIHIRRCNVHSAGEADKEVAEQIYELVELSGYFRKWVNTAETADGSVSDDDDKISLKSCMSLSNSQVNCVLIKSVLHITLIQVQSFRLPPTEKIVFVATGRLVTPQLIRELPVVSTLNLWKTRISSLIIITSRFILVSQNLYHVIAWSGNFFW